MTEFTTLRIYFPNGKRIKGQSFWEKLKSSDYGTELVKRAKAHDINQAINFNVSKGYLSKSKISWGISEIMPIYHPQVIELTDRTEKINSFIKQEDLFLKGTEILMVASQVTIKRIGN